MKKYIVKDLGKELEVRASSKKKAKMIFYHTMGFWTEYMKIEEKTI